MSRILIIDDEEDVRTVLQQVLQHDGYEVVLAAAGAACFEKLGEREAGLVIPHLFMPDKEVIETIREIRQRFPQVRIIAMSGGGTLGKPAYLSTAATLGALSVLQKPFDEAALLQSVNHALNTPAG